MLASVLKYSHCCWCPQYALQYVLLSVYDRNKSSQMPVQFEPCFILFYAMSGVSHLGVDCVAEGVDTPFNTNVVHLLPGDYWSKHESVRICSSGIHLLCLPGSPKFSNFWDELLFIEWIFHWIIFWRLSNEMLNCSTFTSLLHLPVCRFNQLHSKSFILCSPSWEWVQGTFFYWFLWIDFSSFIHVLLRYIPSALRGRSFSHNYVREP